VINPKALLVPVRTFRRLTPLPQSLFAKHAVTCAAPLMYSPCHSTIHYSVLKYIHGCWSASSYQTPYYTRVFQGYCRRFFRMDLDLDLDPCEIKVLDIKVKMDHTQ
jgi:hypothetical protein